MGDQRSLDGRTRTAGAGNDADFLHIAETVQAGAPVGIVPVLTDVRRIVKQADSIITTAKG